MNSTQIPELSKIRDINKRKKFSNAKHKYAHRRKGERTRLCSIGSRCEDNDIIGCCLKTGLLKICCKNIPHNPDIATTFPSSGYVESRGRGMDKMRNLCQEAKIPAPQFSSKGNNFWTVFRKDIYNKEDVSKLRLNDRQIKAMMYVKENGRITNSEYQKLNEI